MTQFILAIARTQPAKTLHWLAFPLLLAGANACKQERDGGARSPAQAVRALHRAAAKDGCDALKTHLAAALHSTLERPHVCEDLKAELRGRPMTSIVEVRKDGRDQRHTLVYVRMRKHDPPMVYKVTLEEGSWRVVSL